MLSNPLHTIFVCNLQVQVHHLLYHCALAAGNTFIKQQLRLHFCNGTAFDGGRVRDDRVQIELLIVYLLRDAEFLVLLQQFRVRGTGTGTIEP